MRDGVDIQRDLIRREKFHQLFLALASGAILGCLTHGKGAQQKTIYQDQNDDNDIF